MVGAATALNIYMIFMADLSNNNVRITKAAVGLLAVIFLAACSSRDGGSSNPSGSSNPDPLADLTYATTEEVPIVIRSLETSNLLICLRSTSLATIVWPTLME